MYATAQLKNLATVSIHAKTIYCKSDGYSFIKTLAQSQNRDSALGSCLVLSMQILQYLHASSPGYS